MYKNMVSHNNTLASLGLGGHTNLLSPQTGGKMGLIIINYNLIIRLTSVALASQATMYWRYEEAQKYFYIWHTLDLQP